jgi:hypothetical protein
VRARLRPRKVLLVLVAAGIPALLFTNVWQGVRYTRLKDAVRRLEEEQTAWYEQNKNLLAAIGIYSSPRRLESLAARDPEVRRASPEDVVRVQVESDAGSGAEQARPND